MRVALASIHPRLLSGQIEGLIGLAQALERDGHTVQVVSAFPSQPLLDANRLKLIPSTQRIFLDQPARMTRILAQLARISPQTDLIQLDLPTPAFSVFGDLLQTLVRVPVIVGYEAHLVRSRDLIRRGYWRNDPKFYLPRLLINNRIMARFTLRRAAHYIVNTEYQKRELFALGVRADRVSRLPIILPHDKLTRAQRAEQAILLPSRRLITYAGHYNHVKGVETLIRAFQMLEERLQDIQLVLAWSGIGEHDRIHQLRSGNDRIIELGHLHVPDLFAASAVVVLPYRLTIGQAAFPATLLEAIAANVPVVTSDLPVLRELTEEGSTAILAPADDPAALAEAIEHALRDQAPARQMREHQKIWIEKMLPERGVKEYERLYERVAARQAAVLFPARDREGV